MAREQHPNDLPDSLSAMVHIFIDVGRLADDLLSANLLPEPDQLWTFIQEACKLEPGVTISDCGSGHQAVDRKMQCESCCVHARNCTDYGLDFYELYLENCHCRHLFMALGHESDYYKVLSTYADDSYTRKKTTLIRPDGGLPEIYNLPFHTVGFSGLENVQGRPISVPGAAPQINGKPLELPRPAPGLNPTAPKVNPTPPTAPRAARQAKEALSRPNGTPSATNRPDSAPVHSAATNGMSPGTPRSAPIGAASAGKQSSVSMSFGQAAPPAVSSPEATILQNASAPPEQVPQDTPSTTVDVAPKEHVEQSGALGNTDHSSSAGVVKLDTSSHSSHQSQNGAEQSWETETSNSYLPAPITGAWGEEPAIQPVAQQHHDPHTNSKRNKASASRRQPKQGGGGGGGGRGPPAERRGPAQYEGSWDDMLENVKPRGSFKGASPSRPATASPIPKSPVPKSTDFEDHFTRQVVIKSEPNPQARPVSSPIALNKLEQRIDLKLPRPSPDEDEAFKVRTKNRHLCNEHHMRGKCINIQCPFDHEEISDGVYLALRNKARTTPCNQGMGCRRHDCYLAHHCPNVSRFSSCARPKCPFEYKGLHGIVDLNVVNMIEPTKNDVESEALLLL